MPTTKTAEKEMRAAGRKTLRNKSVRSGVKTSVSKAGEVISSGNLDAAKAAVKAAISALDKEAGVGAVHRNNAARRKSRLMKKLNKAAVATTKTETVAKKKK